MRATDFFTEEPVSSWSGGDPWATRTVLDEDLLDSLRRGPVEGITDVSAALGLLDLAQEELEAYGTGGGQQCDDRQIALVLRALEALTDRVGLPLKLPFRDFTRFRSYWIRQGASGGGGWQARRDIVDGLLDPTRQQLVVAENSPIGPRLPEGSLANLEDPTAIQEHLRRIPRAIVDDPALAVGSAKELIESTAKVVLLERGQQPDETANIATLVKEAQQALDLHPSSQAPGPDGTDAVRKILGSVSGVAIGVAELRNRGYGTGHGAAGARVGLRARHAHLAVNAAITWCQLMLDTLADTSAPWRSNQ